MNTRVREMAISDKPAVVEAMSKAFDGDVPFNYGLRQDARRHGAMRLAFRAIFDRFFPRGLSVVVNDGQGAALWCRHDEVVLPVWRELLLLPTYIRCSGFDRFTRVTRAFDAMKAHHPRDPHYYLFAIGVDPAFHRQGLGSRLLERTLSACDRQRMPAYLESTSAHNRALYSRHGFEVTSEFPMDDGGPVLTGMWRSPSG